MEVCMKKRLFVLIAVLMAFVCTFALVACEEEEVPTEIVKYTVTFDLNYDGAPTATKVTVDANTNVAVQKAPTRTGYNFGGWFTDKDCKSEFKFGKTVSEAKITKNITLYAKWTKQTIVETIVLSSISATYSGGEVTVGGVLDTSRISVEATYSDGNKKLVQGYSVSGFESTTAGEKTVTVSYTESGVTKTTTFNVTVVAGTVAEVTLTSITASYNGSDIAIGGTLDISSIEVTAFYSDGSSKTVEGFVIEGFESLTAGEKTVTISYTEDGTNKTAQLIVNVVDTQTVTTKKLYFKPVSSTAWTVVNAYAFTEETNYLGAFPGTAMTAEEDGWYSIEVDVNATTIIFNNKVADTENEGVFIGEQTADLTIGTDAYYIFNADDVVGTWGADNTVQMPVADKTVIYFYNGDAWENVYAYAYTDSTNYLGAWPGTAMTADTTNVGWYSVQVNENAVNIIFNNGAEQQTDDLVIDASTPYYKDGEWSETMDTSETPDPITYVSVYVKVVSETPWTTYNVHYWSETNNSVGSAWPGTAMTAVSGQDGWFVAEIDDRATKVIFNNAVVGVDGNAQTADLVLDGEKYYYAYNADLKAGVWGTDFSVEAPTVTPTVEVYYYNENAWTTINVHSWNGNNVYDVWPGIAMTAVDGQDGWYKATINADSVNVLFNSLVADTENESGFSGEQTADLVLDGENYYYYDGYWFNTFVSLDSIEASYEGTVLQGDELDKASLTVLANYGDTLIEVTDYTVTNFSSEEVGNVDVTITYKGKTDVVTITVAEVVDVTYYFYNEDGWANVYAYAWYYKFAPEAPTANDYVIKGIGGDWDVGLKMDKMEDVETGYVYTQLTVNGTDGFKVNKGNVWCGTIGAIDDGITYTGGGDANIVLEAGTYDVEYYTDTYTVVIRKYVSGNQTGTQAIKTLGDWPGTAMTAVDNFDIDGWYSITVSSKASLIIFNDNDENQTEDFVLDTTKPYYYGGQWYADRPHIHKIVAVAKVDATCTEDGKEAHYRCTGDCGKLFSDENGTNEITEASLIIEASHTLESVAKVDATCTESGKEAHYKCSICGNLFSDENGETAIEEEDLIIEEKGHTYEYECSTSCSVCDEGERQAEHSYVDGACEHCGTPEPAQVVLSSITASLKNVDNIYYVGAELTISDFTVIKVMSDNSQKVLTPEEYETATVALKDGSSNNSVGDQVYVITYAEKTAEVTVDFKRELLSITVEREENVLYGTTEDGLKEKITVTANFANEIASAVVTNYTISGYNGETLEAQDIEISYVESNKTATKTITITLNDYITEIVATYTGTINHNDVIVDINKENITAKIVYASGTEENLTEYTIDSVTSNVVGDTAGSIGISAVIDEIPYSYTITDVKVIAYVESYSVNYSGAKEIAKGQEIAKDSVSVRAIYSDNTEKDLSIDEFELDYDNTLAGDVEISVTVNETEVGTFSVYFYETNTYYFYNEDGWANVYAYAWKEETVALTHKAGDYVVIGSFSEWGVNGSAIMSYNGTDEYSINGLRLSENDEIKIAKLATATTLEEPYFNNLKGGVSSDIATWAEGDANIIIEKDGIFDIYYKVSGYDLGIWIAEASTEIAPNTQVISTPIIGEWPGTAMTAVEGQTGWYSITLDTRATKIIFNDNDTEEVSKTGDLNLDATTPYYVGESWVSKYPTSISVVENEIGNVFVGDELSKDKFTVTVTYNDGSTETTTDYTLELDTDTVTEIGVDRSVVITYTANGLTFTDETIKVAVYPKLTGIATTGSITVNYKQTGDISIDELTFTASYNGADAVTIDNEALSFDIGTYTAEEDGTITVTYTDSYNQTAETLVNVTVTKVLHSISVQYIGEAIYVGDELDKSKLSITANYVGGGTDALDGTADGVEVNFSSTSGGIIAGSVMYQDKSAGFNVEVIKTATSYTATYAESVAHNADFSADGLTITVVFDDNSYITLENDYQGLTITEPDFTVVGTATIGLDLTYEGADLGEKTVNVTVYKVLSSIEVTHSTGSVYADTTINKDDYTITATYSNGDEAVIDSNLGSVTFTYDFAEIAQDVVVTVVYTETYPNSNAITKEATVTVNVIEMPTEPVLDSITASYTQGDTVIYVNTDIEDVLDVIRNDVTVTAHYTEGTPAKEDAEVDTWTAVYRDGNNTTSGNTVIIISYTEEEETKTTTINVVLTRVLTSITVNPTNVNIVKNADLTEQITVTASFDGEDDSVVDNYTVSEYNNVDLFNEEQTVTITYVEGTAIKTCDVTVTLVPSITGIVATYTGTINHNDIVSEIDVANVSVEYVYDYGDNTQCNDTVTVTAVTSATVGSNTGSITVEVNGYSYTITNIEVVKVLAGISASYSGGEVDVNGTLDSSKVTVNYVYSDETTEKINDSTLYTIGTYDFSTEGSKTIEITLNADNAMSANITVVVNDVETIYFKTENNSWTDVKAYLWVSDDSESELNSTWPGVAMTDSDSDGWYELEIDVEIDRVIFNNGTKQTTDLVVDASKPYYIFDATYVVGAWGADTTVTTPTTRTIYYYNLHAWTKVYAYSFVGETYSVVWPGTEMTAVGDDGWYSAEINKTETTIIFNNNDGAQTANLTMDYTKPYFIAGVWQSSNEIPTTVTITLNKNGIGWSDSSATVTVYTMKDAKFHNMTYNSNTGIYSIEISLADLSGGIIFTRHSSSTPTWDNKWNQTGDVNVISTRNYTLTDWNSL